MNSCAHLSPSYVISALLFTPQPHCHLCPLSSAQAGCLLSEPTVSELISRWRYRTCSKIRDLQHHLPPPPRCASIKADLIKPQLTATAGGGHTITHWHLVTVFNVWLSAGSRLFMVHSSTSPSDWLPWFSCCSGSLLLSPSRLPVKWTKRHTTVPTT